MLAVHREGEEGDPSRLRASSAERERSTTTAAAAQQEEHSRHYHCQKGGARCHVGGCSPTVGLGAARSSRSSGPYRTGCRSSSPSSFRPPHRVPVSLGLHRRSNRIAIADVVDPSTHGAASSGRAPWSIWAGRRRSPSACSCHVRQQHGPRQDDDQHGQGRLRRTEAPGGRTWHKERQRQGQLS